MKFHYLLFFSFLICFYIFKGSSYAETKKRSFPSNDLVVGHVLDKPLYLRDLDDLQIYQLRKKLYELIQSRWVNKSVEILTEQVPKYKMNKSIPTEKEIRQFYKQKQLQKQGSYEDLKPQIKDFIQTQNRLTATNIAYQRGLNQGAIKSYLAAPDTFVVTVPVDEAFIRGNKRAKVMVLEFSDYQCGFCKRVQPTISNLIGKYKNQVAFAYRHLPLSFHAEADEASIAVECAREQGLFSQYHLLLFDNQRSLNVSDLKSYARSLKIADLKRFDNCLDNEKYRSRVKKDMHTANKIGISGTPGFVIGTYDYKKNEVKGEILSGALPEGQFEQLLSKYLTK